MNKLLKMGLAICLSFAISLAITYLVATFFLNPLDALESMQSSIVGI